jgi:hypothetical protein
LPNYPQDTNAVVLLEDRLVTVSSSGEIRSTYRKAFRILRPAGHEKGTLYVYFDSQTEITSLKAWSITAAGEEFEVKKGGARAQRTPRCSRVGLEFTTRKVPDSDDAPRCPAA